MSDQIEKYSLRKSQAELFHLPCQSVIPITPMTRSRIAQIIENGKSLLKEAPSTATGVIIAQTPITTIRLKIFEPVTLLTAMCIVVCYRRDYADCSFRSDVPIATIVSPMISDGTLNRFATLELPSTNRSAPFTRNTNPATRHSKHYNKWCFINKFFHCVSSSFTIFVYILLYINIFT